MKVVPSLCSFSPAQCHLACLYIKRVKNVSSFLWVSFSGADLSLYVPGLLFSLLLEVNFPSLFSLPLYLSIISASLIDSMTLLFSKLMTTFHLYSRRLTLETLETYIGDIYYIYNIRSSSFHGNFRLLGDMFYIFESDKNLHLSSVYPPV